MGESSGNSTAGVQALEQTPVQAVAAIPMPPPWMTQAAEGDLIEESEHRAMLRAFHKLLIGGRRMFVLPRLNKEAAEFYTENLALLPRELHKRELRDAAEGEEDYDQDYSGETPYTMPNPFSRGPRWNRPSGLAALSDVNSYGYDMQTPVNPIVCKIRGQRTVAVCMNVLADGDDWNLDAQLAALAGFQDEIVAITESGRRGVHAVFRLRRPIPNPHRLHWREARRAQQGKDLTANLPEFRAAAETLKMRLQAAGFDTDKMIVDHSVLTRLPGFRHGGTGRACRLLYLNPRPWSGGALHRVFIHPDVKAVWQRPPVVALGCPPALGDKVVDPPVLGDSLGDPPSEGGLFDCVEGLGGKTGGSGGGVCGVLVDVGGKGRGGDVVPVNVYTSPPEAAPRRANRRDFLADWQTYQSLKAQGVPARHQRHRLHMAMFSVATVMGWSDGTLAREWRSIVSIRPANIGYDADRAVSDMLGGWSARGRRESIRLPDIARLPDLDGGKVEALTGNLKAAGCPHPPLAARMVAEMIVPMGRTLCAQSKDGTLGLSSRAMLATFGCRYAAARGGLVAAGLLEITDGAYMSGRQTMQYRIHWAKLLIMCGHRTEDVLWS